MHGAFACFLLVEAAVAQEAKSDDVVTLGYWAIRGLAQAARFMLGAFL